MAGWQSKPKQRTTFAAGAAIVLLAAWHTAPAIASSNNASLRSDPGLEIPASELTVTVVSHEVDANGIDVADSADETDVLSPSHYLAPRVEAVLRRVFEESATPIADSDKQPEMNTRIPGVSDDEMARYKRQMYRTDI